MPESDENFEDELDTEELDDLWDDDLGDGDFQDVEMDDDLQESDDPVNAQDHKKKKKSSSKALVYLIILGAVGYAGYMFLDPLGSSTPDIPIVTIEEASNTGVVDEQNMAALVPEEAVEQPPETTTSLSNSSLDSQLSGQENVADTAEENSVLTPMPDNLQDMEIALPDLIATPAGDQSNSVSEESKEQLVLVEDDLLSKTELPSKETESATDTQELTALEKIEQKMKEANDTSPVEDEIESTNSTLALNEIFDSSEQDLPGLPTLSQVDEEATDDQEINSEVNDTATVEDQIKPDFLVKDEIESIYSEDGVQENPEPLVLEAEKPQAEPLEEVEAEPAVQNNTASEQEAAKEEVEKTVSTEEKKTVSPKKKIEKKWVIKAAQPNKAVIYDKVTRETKSIEVGDTVHTLGRINSIENSSGRWIVKGSLKSVKQ